MRHIVIIERIWFESKNTARYLYEFDAKDFILQDKIARYYVEKWFQEPIRKYRIDNLFQKLFSKNMELPMVGDFSDVTEKNKLKFSPFAEWKMHSQGNESLAIVQLRKDIRNMN